MEFTVKIRLLPHGGSTQNEFIQRLTSDIVKRWRKQFQWAMDAHALPTGAEGDGTGLPRMVVDDMEAWLRFGNALLLVHVSGARWSSVSDKEALLRSCVDVTRAMVCQHLAQPEGQEPPARVDPSELGIAIDAHVPEDDGPQASGAEREAEQAGAQALVELAAISDAAAADVAPPLEQTLAPQLEEADICSWTPSGVVPLSPKRAFFSKEMSQADLEAEVLLRTQQVSEGLGSPSSGSDSRRYFGNVSANRPYELELDRWNHEPRPEGQGEDDVDEAEEEESGLAGFEQLRCLTGQHRQGQGSGGGIYWTPIRGLAGVFLRRRDDPRGAIVWLPEAAPNLLLQARAEQPWELLQVFKLRKERTIVDRAPKTRYSEGKDLNFYADVSVMERGLGQTIVRDAEAHLTERWLEAASDLRILWGKDWKPLRSSSPFELAQSKFHYHPSNKLSDALRGYFGEERWQWHWQEDGRGAIAIKNRAWPEGAALCLASGRLVFEAPNAEPIAW